MIRRQVSSFLGVVSSLDPRDIPDSYAQDALNVRIEDGLLRPRYGYRRLNVPDGVDACYGLAHLLTYSTSRNEELEEFMSFERDADTGAVHPFVYDPRPEGTDCQGTSRDGHPEWFRYAVTDASGTAPELDASDWVGFGFDQHAYLINETDGVSRYTPECPNSWVSFDAPPTPNPPLWEVVYGDATRSPYKRYDFTNVNPATDITLTGAASTATITSDGDIKIVHGSTGGGGGAIASVTIDLTNSGKANWYDNDIFLWLLQVPSGDRIQQISEVSISFINDDDEEFFPTDVEEVNHTIAGYFISRTLRLEFGNKIRSQWGSLDNSPGKAKIKKLKISYRVVAAFENGGTLYIRKPWTGGVWLAPDPTGEREPGRLTIGHSWLHEITNESSDIAFAEIPRQATVGYSVFVGTKRLGSQIRLTIDPFPSANYKARIWVLAPDDWRLVDTLPTEDERGVGDTEYDYEITWSEVLLLTKRKDIEESAGVFKGDNCVNAFVFRGSVCWLYSEGRQNVRYSEVGNPTKQASITDDEEDQSRGATFTLSPAFDDTPLWGADVGDGVIIVGKRGVYSQVGNLPSQMAPPVRLPGSAGCPNKFCAVRWKQGETDGVAALSRDGSAIYFYRVDSTNGDNPPSAVEISAAIRPSLREFLVDTQDGVSDFSQAFMVVDPQMDALWLVNGRRAVVLRRASLADNTRPWEFYEFNTGEDGRFLRYGTSSPRWRIKFAFSDCGLAEPEWNTTSETFISGELQDGGFPMPKGFWRSKVWWGNRRRYFRLLIDREPLDPVEVEVFAGDESRLYLCHQGKKWVRVYPDQRDEALSFKLYVTETSAPVRGVLMEESDSAGKGVQYV